LYYFITLAVDDKKFLGVNCVSTLREGDKLTMRTPKIKFVIVTTIIIALLASTCLCGLASAKQQDWQAEPLHRVKASGFNPNALGDGQPYFNPAEIKAAYGLSTILSAGSGTTIAIVDAYDNPKVASDLALFSAQFGLPTASLEVHKMSSFVRADSGWALEIALDVQWAHAIAPGARILLVEANSASLGDLLSAVNYARSRSDVSAISMSWGSNEFSGESAYESYFTSAYGASFFASSGDTGGAIIWPSSSANVVSVGGTTLTQVGSGYVETAWSDSGGGISTQIAKPAYQASVPYGMRSTPDVSYVGDPNTGFLVINNYGKTTTNNWYVVGGTSAGAPQWAAIYAIGKSATNANFYAGYPGSYGVDFTDVVNGVSGGFSAGFGYDLCTGIGSPLGSDFGAAPVADFTVSASPSSLTVQAGGSATTTVTVTSINGFSKPVTVSATVPDGWSVPASVTVTPTGSAVMNIAAPAGASGSYQVVLSATVGTTIKTTTVNVQVVKADYSLSANPTSLSIRQGYSGTSKVTVNAVNGYSGSVTLSASGLPTGAKATLSKNPVSAGSYATLTISTIRTTTKGTYTVTVNGVDASGLAHLIKISVRIY
jgi:subtilase family serine protease